MDSSQPASLTLRSSSAVSLHQRFSQVLVDQLAQSRLVTSDPIQKQQRVTSDPPVMVLVVKKEPDSVQVQQPVRRRSVWTRLGWNHHGASRTGFWSFRNKYRFRFRSRIRSRIRSRFGSRIKSRFGSRIRSRFGSRAAYRRRVTPRRRLLYKPPAGRRPHLSPRGGGASDHLPTKKQLDQQLEDYMSQSRTRLDQQLEDYMSQSRTRLDQQLDEYMSMAGQTPLDWT